MRSQTTGAARKAAGIPADGNPAILVININMEDDRVETFTLRLNDDPQEIVRKFAVKNKMSPHATRQMLTYVLENRARLVEELESKSSSKVVSRVKREGRDDLNHEYYDDEETEENRFSENKNGSDSYLLRQVEDPRSRASQLTRQRYDNANRQAVIPEKEEYEDEVDGNELQKPDRIQPRRGSGKVNLNMEDQFADQIAKQIEYASNLIYKTGSKPSSAKPTVQPKISQKSLPKQPLPKESKSTANPLVKDSRRSSSSEHHLNQGRQRGPGPEERVADESFKSFRGKRPGSAQSINKSQTSLDTDKIFNRLYAEGLAKYTMKQHQMFEKQLREEVIMKEIKIDRGKRYSEQIVDRLYYKGIVREDVKKFNNEKTKALNELEKSSEYTFHPRISHFSSVIANTREERKTRPLEDYLIDSGLSKKKKTEQAHAIKKSEELGLLQQKPRISEVSKILAHNKSQFEGKHGASKHEELFEDSAARKHKSMILQEIYHSEEQLSFRPEINEESRKIVYHKHGDQSFVERLSKYANEKEAKIMLDKAHAYPPLAQMINPDTNMPYFQPLTGRPPSAYRGSADIGVGNYLHSLSAQKQAKLEARREMEFDRKRLEKSAIPHSSNIVEEKKQSVFKAVFDSLDSDRDGVISAEKVDIESLDSEILKIISPMLINMEELAMEIDEQTFVYGMHEIYKKLCVSDRDKLMAEYRPKRRFLDKDCTFKPQLNPTSLKMAANKKSIMETTAVAVAKKKSATQNKYEFDSEGNALTVVNEETSETRSHYNQLEEELQGCTFQPQLNDYMPSASHYV